MNYVICERWYLPATSEGVKVAVTQSRELSYDFALATITRWRLNVRAGWSDFWLMPVGEP